MEVDVYTPMATLAILATFLIVTCSGGLFQNRPIFINGVVLLNVLLAICIYANLIGKQLIDVPEVLLEILTKKDRPVLIIFWGVNVAVSILFVVYVVGQGSATTVHRKFFHLTVSLIYISGIIYDPLFLWLCGWLILSIFVIIEVLRYYEVPPWNSHLSNMLVFHDRQDGEVLLTQILLHIGIFLPILIPGSINWRSPKIHLHHFAGVAAVGVGDSFAAIVGSKFGKIHWPGSKKTVEGTIAMATSMAIFLIVTATCINQPVNLVFILLVSTINSAIETFLPNYDNVILPLATYLML